MNPYYDLLKSWCDRLIELQLTDTNEKIMTGGILCPSCAMIHGRIGDAVYPFVLLYDQTKDEKYLNAAKLVMRWTKNNTFRRVGCYGNDKLSTWCATTAFFATALGKTLLYHGKCLDADTYDAWYNEFLQMIAFCEDYLPKIGANINYYAAFSALNALAFKLTGNESYKPKAYHWAAYVKEQIDEDFLLAGEGEYGAVTPKGCVYVDLGYNVEESLVSMVEFAYFVDDDAYMQLAEKMYKAHICFMLPDGAWDNSWGTRANKWTYWGSRTSDGAGGALSILAARDAVFAEAAERNFELLCRCTKNGHLFGGPMYASYGEAPCVHHAFAHAKSLCDMINHGFSVKKRVSLPRDARNSLQSYLKQHVWLISQGNLRVTATDCDAVCYKGASVSGGTLSCVWHEKIGLAFYAVTAEYVQTESYNMQLSFTDLAMPNCAIRIVKDRTQSVNDKNAVMTVTQTDNMTHVHSDGILKDISFVGHVPYSLDYEIYDNRIVLTATAGEDAVLYLPVVCDADEQPVLTDGVFSIKRAGGTVRIAASDQAVQYESTNPVKHFHVIGGFGNLPICVKLRAGKPTRVFVEFGE